jgi:hypothetical protein
LTLRYHLYLKSSKIFEPEEDNAKELKFLESHNIQKLINLLSLGQGSMISLGN